MNKETKRDYRFLDTEEDRKALIEDIRRVRRDVRRLAEIVPRDKWYEPRYHGWSLAALLGHLQMMDTLCRILIQFGMMGVSFPISEAMLNHFNDFMGRVFKQRVVETTLKGLDKGEKTVTNFILQVPLDRFSRLVYDPAHNSFLTVEQALQEFFLYHWQWHLDDIRQVDDIHYQPPRSSEV